MATLSEADGVMDAFLFFAGLLSLLPLTEDVEANVVWKDGSFPVCFASCSHKTTIKRRTPNLTLALSLAICSDSVGAREM
jgi:hypothetical protein